MALWKYEIVVLPAEADTARRDRIWELGRSGWELVSVMPGDWDTGATDDTTKMTWFMKREATHDIAF